MCTLLLIVAQTLLETPEAVSALGTARLQLVDGRVRKHRLEDILCTHASEGGGSGGGQQEVTG